MYDDEDQYWYGGDDDDDDDDDWSPPEDDQSDQYVTDDSEGDQPSDEEGDQYPSAPWDQADPIRDDETLFADQGLSQDRGDQGRDQAPDLYDLLWGGDRSDDQSTVRQSDRLIKDYQPAGTREPTDTRERDLYDLLWGGDRSDDQHVGPARDQRQPGQPGQPAEAPEPPGPVIAWADGTPMDDRSQRLARGYQVGLQRGLDPEGARALVSVLETEGGLYGAVNTSDPGGGSFGPLQLNGAGELINFAAWLKQQGIQGDPRQLANDIDLATTFAVDNYLGNTIRQAQAAGVHGADLATYAQQHGQVSVNPWKAGQNYQKLFGQGDPFGQALAASVPSQSARGLRAAQIPPGHYQGDGHDHGVATPYTEQAVDRAGDLWTVAFDFGAKYDHPFNPAIPVHRGVDLILNDQQARQMGVGRNGEGFAYPAFRSGTVAAITNDPNGGIGIIVDTGDPNARYDRYFHNNSVNVQVGDQVVAGVTRPGIVGETGTEGFPHLHYEVSQGINGDPIDRMIDPRPYMNRPLQPQQTAPQPPAAPPAAQDGYRPLRGNQPTGAPAAPAAAQTEYRPLRDTQTTAAPPPPPRPAPPSAADLGLDQATYGQLQTWQQLRQARGEDPTDTGAFREHLRAIGAPDPWAQPTPARPTGAPAAPEQPQARQVYTVGGREVSETEYRAAEARNAELDRQQAALGRIDAGERERYDAARREQDALTRWHQRVELYNTDTTGEVGDPGPRPDTGNLDWLEARQAAGQDSGPREQTAEQRAELATWTERLSTDPDRGPREATPAVNRQFAQDRRAAALREIGLSNVTPSRLPDTLGLAAEDRWAQADRQQGQAASAQIADENQRYTRPGSLFATGQPALGPSPTERLASEQARARDAQRTENAAARARGEAIPYPEAERQTYEPSSAVDALAPSGGPFGLVSSFGARLGDAIGQSLLRNPGATWQDMANTATRTAYGAIDSLYIRPTEFIGDLLASGPMANARMDAERRGLPVPSDAEVAARTPWLGRQIQQIGREASWAAHQQADMLEEGRLARQAQGIDVVRPPDRPMDWRDPRDILAMTVENAPVTIAAIGAAWATGGAAALLGVGEAGAGLAATGAASGLMFGTEGGDAYRQARAAGLDQQTALGLATINGAVNAYLEDAPVLSWIADAAGPAVRRQAARALTVPGIDALVSAAQRGARIPGVPLVGRLLHHGFTEGEEEIEQGLFSNAIAQTYDGNQTLMEGLAEGFAGGFIPGMLLGSTQSHAHAASAAAADPRTTLRPTYRDVTPILPDDVRALPSGDWSTYVVQRARPDGGAPTQALVEIGPDGVISARSVREDEIPAAAMPRVDTPGMRDQAVRQVSRLVGWMREQGILSAPEERAAVEGFTRAADDGLSVVRGAAEKVTRASEAPHTAAEAPSGAISDGPQAALPSLPESWGEPIAVPNSPLELRVRGDADPEIGRVLARQPATAALGTLASDLEQHLTGSLRAEGVLPQGRERPLGLMFYGGAVGGLNHGRVARGRGGVPTDADAISLDIGQELIHARLDADKQGIDWRRDPRFVDIMDTRVRELIGHEVFHDIFAGATTAHSPEHYAAIHRAAELLETEQPQSKAVIRELWESGQLDNLARAHYWALGRSSPVPIWRDYGRTEYARLTDDGPLTREQRLAGPQPGPGQAGSLAGAGEEGPDRAERGPAAGLPGGGALRERGAVADPGALAGGGAREPDLGRPAYPGVAEHPELARARARGEQRGVARIRSDANEYVRGAGIRPAIPQTAYVRNDVPTQQRIADYYERAVSDPSDPRTRAAYRQMAREVDDQYQYLVSKGVRFVPYYDDRPAGDGADFHGYPDSQSMVRDLDQNNRLYVYADYNDHPLLSPPGTPYDQSDNWKFRAVHDYFGHAAQGFEFGPRGEESAWLEHVKMFSPLAARAMTTETRGQNSWANFRPGVADLPLAERGFAEQKVFLLPGWALSRPEAYPGEHRNRVLAAANAAAGADGSVNLPTDGTRQQAEYAAALLGRERGLPEVVVAHLTPTGNTGVAVMTLGDPETAGVLADLFAEAGIHASRSDDRGAHELFLVGRDLAPADFVSRVDEVAGILSDEDAGGAVSHQLADVATFTEDDYDHVIGRGPGEDTAAGPRSLGPPEVARRVGTGTTEGGADQAGPGSERAVGDLGAGAEGEPAAAVGARPDSARARLADTPHWGRVSGYAAQDGRLVYHEPETGYAVQDGKLVHRGGDDGAYRVEDGKLVHDPTAGGRPQAAVGGTPTGSDARWTPEPPIESDELRLFRQAAFNSQRGREAPEGAIVRQVSVALNRPNARKAGVEPGTRVELPAFVTRSGGMMPLPPSGRGLMGSLVNLAYNQMVGEMGGHKGMPSGRWKDHRGNIHRYDSPQEIVFMWVLDEQLQDGKIKGWWRGNNNPREDLRAIPYISTNRDKGGLRVYEPDFIIQHNDGTWEVWEAKPAPVLANSEEYGVSRGAVTGKMGWDVAKKSNGIVPVLAEMGIKYRLVMGRDAAAWMPEAPRLDGKGKPVKSFVAIPGVDWRDLGELERPNKKPKPELTSLGNRIADVINDTSANAVKLAGELRAAGLGDDDRRAALFRFTREQVLPTAQITGRAEGETRPLDTPVAVDMPSYIRERGPQSLDDVAEFDPEMAELIRDAQARGLEIAGLAFDVAASPDDPEGRPRLFINTTGDPQLAQRLAAQLGAHRGDDTRADYWYYDNQGRSMVHEVRFEGADGNIQANLEQVQAALGGADAGIPRLQPGYNSDGSLAAVHILGIDYAGDPISADDLDVHAMRIHNVLGTFGIRTQPGVSRPAVIANFGAEGGYGAAIERREQILGLRPVASPARGAAAADNRRGSSGGAPVHAGAGRARGPRPDPRAARRGDSGDAGAPSGPHASVGPTPGEIDPETRRRMAEMAAANHVRDGGSTTNARRGNLAGTDNYSVSIYPERGEIFDAAPTAAQLEDYITRNADLLADPRISLGTWYDADETHKHYIDVSAVLPDREQAIALGRQYNQLAIYGLKDRVEIKTGGTGSAIEGLPPEAERLPRLEQSSDRPEETTGPDVLGHYGRGVGGPADQGRAGADHPYAGGEAAGDSPAAGGEVPPEGETGPAASVGPAPERRSGRASMTRQAADEDEIVADNRQEINERYSGDMGEIVVKETVQNSVDASRETPGAHTTVSIQPSLRKIQTVDQGSGMAYDTVMNEFTRFKGSKKVSGASGGKGTAKTAILGRAQKLELRTVVERPDGQHEETIAWGTADDYLRPSVGLAVESGPLGWVDQAVADGTLPLDSLTEASLLAPWSDGTGTRLSTVLEPSAQWQLPSGNKYSPSPLESWIDDFLASNRLDGQTISFELDGQPYTPTEDAGASAYRANTLLKTISGPTWQIDVYGSEAMTDRTSMPVKIQNNGLYQITAYPRLPSPARLPWALTANVRATVGAKDAGYPWSADRMRLVAGAQEAIDGYIVNELYGDVVRRESNALERAIAGGIEIPGGDGRLFNIGSVEGAELASLEDLAKRPYLRVMNDGMTRLHRRLSELLDGKSWPGFYEGGTFDPSSFGGFGISSAWLGLNVPLRGLQTRYPSSSSYLLLYDPWGVTVSATNMATSLGIPLTGGPARASSSATKGASPKPLKLTRALADWDPNAEVPYKTKDGGTETIRPRDFGWEIDYQRKDLERAKERGDRWSIERYTDRVQALTRARAAYLRKLGDHLAARAIYYGEPPEMVNPAYPEVRPRTLTGKVGEEPPPYYPSIYEPSPTRLYDSILQERQNLEQARTEEEDNPDRIARYEKALAEREQALGFNEAVEMAVWRHKLAEGQLVYTDVDGEGYALNQEGLDSLAYRLSDAIDSNERYYSTSTDAWNRQYGQRRVDLLRYAVGRIEEATGLRATVDDTGAQAAQASMRALVDNDRPLSEQFLDHLAGYWLAIPQHEFVHNAVREHEKAAFSRFLSEVVAFAGDQETRGIVRGMIDELARTGGLRALAADIAQYSQVKNAENVFEKVGVEATGDDIGRELEATGEPGDRALPDGGEEPGRPGPGGVPGAGRAAGDEPDDGLLAGPSGRGRPADQVRDVPGGRQGLARSVPSSNHAPLARAAESAAQLQEALVRALYADQPPEAMDPTDRRVAEGHARYFTSAVLGLATNDGALLDTVGLTHQQAQAERLRALDLLEGHEGPQPLYDAERAWAQVHEAAGPQASTGPLPPEQPVDPFYSKLARTIDQKMPNRASAAQIRGLLRGQVKPDEMAWTGLDDYLDAQGDRPIAKADVQAYLDQNQVRVQEVVRGGEPTKADVSSHPAVQAAQQARLDAMDAINRAREQADLSGDPGPLRRAMQASQHAREAVVQAELDAQKELQAASGSSGPTRYERYTLPGGQNYRELLLTLPPQGERPGSYSRQADEVARTMQAEFPNGLRDALGDINNIDVARTQRYWALEEQHRQLNEQHNRQVQGYIGENYTSGHWDEPNVVAHIRLNERTDADGKPLLFLEEIQSDWHQAGRKQGYRGDTNDAQARRYEELGGASPDMRALREQGLWDEYLAVRQAVRQPVVEQRVPDAPFKKTWPELAFRRAIRWAAEHGFDRIGWTTGEQQNDRYDLSNQVRTVTYNPETRNLRLYMRENTGGGNARDETVAPERLGDHIGRELAEKLLAQPVGRNGAHTLTGLDVKVPGKGMQGFYDKMLVDTAAKLGKAFGARVGSTRLEIPSSARNSSTEKIRALSEEENVNGDIGAAYLLRQVSRVGGVANPEQALEGMRNDNLARYGVTDRSFQVARERLRAAFAGSQATVHVMDIPAAMKRSALLEGQPLFSVGPLPGDDDLAQGELPGFDELPSVPPAWGDDDRDPYEYVDPEILDAIDSEAAYQEIDDPDAPPRTDSPDQVAQVLPPIQGPVDPGRVDYDQFPDWAQNLLSMGEANVTEPYGPSLDSRVRDVHLAIMNGPNAARLSSAEVDALRGTILWQYDRLTRAAARGGAGQMDAGAAARVIEEARRYTALMGLATTPRDQWAALESVWKSAPISQGDGETLDDFLKSQRALRSTGRPQDQAAAQRAGVQRAAQLIGGQRPRMRRQSPQQQRQAVSAVGSAIAGVVRSPGATPSGVARAVATPQDLSISPLEWILAARYNNLLIGPRGILVDYATNSGQLLYKALSDPLLPGQGGFNPRARWAITQVETAAIGRMLPLMMTRISGVVLDGVSDSQAAAQGAPHSLVGRLDARIEDADARGDRGAQIALRGGKVATIGLTEVAGRLKNVADVGIRTLAFGMEQARQAGIIAWQEGKYAPGSEEWHRRVAEIMDGQNIPRDRYEEMLANSTREAERVVYQGQMGTVGRWMEKVQRHPIGQLVLPFLRALYHIRGWAIDLSPLGAAVTTGDVMRAGVYRGLRQSEAGRKVLGATRNFGRLAGGPYQEAWRGQQVGPAVADLDRRMMANAIGTAAFFWMVSTALEGGLSASGPPDDAIPLIDEDKPDFEAIKLAQTMRAQGWRPYSIRIPWVNGQHYWVSYSNWGPLGYLLAAAGALGEAYRYGLPPEKQRATTTLGRLGELATQGDADTAKTAARRFFGVVKDMSYLQGFMDLYGLAENTYTLFGAAPEGESTGDKIKRERAAKAEMARYAGNLLTTLIPVGGLVNTIAQSQDPHDRVIEYGSIKQQLAQRIPERGYPIPPEIGPPDVLTERLRDPMLASTTGRRQGLAERVDAIGRPAPNDYAGAYAWLPFRAAREDLSSPTLNALVEAKVGVPIPPTELYYRPDGAPATKAVYVQITPRMRQEMARVAGEKIDRRVQELLKEVPEAERRADPQAWHDRLADEMKTIYDQVKKDEGDNTSIRANLLDPLSQMSDRVRPWEPKPKPGETPTAKSGAAADDATPTPDDEATPTSGPGATPTASKAPLGPTVAARATSAALGTPTPTPRSRTAGGTATPTPRGAALTATPRPIAPPTTAPRPASTSGPAQSQAERDRELIRQRARTPVPSR